MRVSSMVEPAESHDLRALASRVFDSIDVSDTTRADYRYRIRLFLDFISATGMNRNSLLDYKRSIGERNDISVATKNKYMAAARVFLGELYRLGYLPVDITVNVKGFQQSKKHKRLGITDDEMGRLAAHIRSLLETPASARLRALVCLLAFQGLRQIEISRLDVMDVDLAHGTAMVHGKGRDDKEMVSLHPETIKALSKHISLHGIADGPLFMGYSGNSRRLTTRGVRSLIQSTLRELGINKTVHGFRHYFTTKLVKTYKGDLLSVAQYTRHRSLEMLQVYNDSIKAEADLPRFYATFAEASFDAE